MKKLLTVVALSSAIVLTFVGCGQKSAVQQSEQGANQQIQRGQGANFNTPEFKLRRELSSLTRLQRGDAPLSKEQIAKITPIINDIKAKDSIEQAYADSQVAAIQAVLTDAQKNALTTRPNMNNNQQGGQNQGGPQQDSGQAGNGQTGNEDSQSGNGGRQRGNLNGQQSGNGTSQPGSGQQVSLKEECSRVLDELQKGQ